jgi:two-component system cell cycle sensor histidine kinase/response regulator CckA
MSSRPKSFEHPSSPPASGPVAASISDSDRLRVLDHVDGGIAVCHADTFLYANEPLLRILGHASLEGLSAHKVSAIAGAATYDVWLEAGVTGQPHTESWRRADGAVSRVDVSASTMTIGNERVCVALVLDASAAARGQAQLQQTERLAAVGTLAAGVAHQLNNPLAYVLANINFLAEEIPQFLRHVAPSLDGPQTVRLSDLLSAMSDAREGAERVARIVRDLRTFSRMEDERREVLDVRTLLESACGLIESELRNRGVLVKVFDVVASVEANPSRLAQAFLNLLLNAAQAIPEGDPTHNEVGVRTYTDDDGMVVVEVRDSGIGMSPAVQARIFDPFYTLKPVGVGTGLGLTTSLAIIHHMKGSLSVESDEGHGSTFRVKLPPAIRSSRRTTVSSSAPEEVARQRVLIVDDEMTLLSSLRRALSRDVDIEVASSAADALAVLERDDHFDVVLCDIMMPEVNGIELYERVSSKHPNLRDRFVFMTGGALSVGMLQFLDSTDLPRLDKPFDVRELRRVLRRHAKAAEKNEA